MDFYFWDSIMASKRGNSVAKDLRTPKYRMRVISPAKVYNRKKEERKMIREYRYE